MDTKRIAIIEGDGIGKEVIAVGVALLKRLAELRGYPLSLVPFDLGADRFLRDGATFPEEDQQTIRETCDAVLLGAIGDPRVPSLDYARDIMFGLRFGLDLYCNIRPMQCLHERLMPLEGKTPPTATSWSSARTRRAATWAWAGSSSAARPTRSPSART